MIGRNVFIAMGIIVFCFPFWVQSTDPMLTENNLLITWLVFSVLAALCFLFAYEQHKTAIKERKLNQIDSLIEEKHWQQAFEDCPQYINVETRIFLKQHYDIQPKTK